MEPIANESGETIGRRGAIGTMPLIGLKHPTGSRVPSAHWPLVMRLIAAELNGSAAPTGPLVAAPTSNDGNFPSPTTTHKPPRTKMAKYEGIIRVTSNKSLKDGSMGGRQWEVLRAYDGRAVIEFYDAAKAKTRITPAGTFQTGNWWSREISYCIKHGCIRLE